MVALELKQIKKFMHALLLTDTFDSLRVREVRIVTFAEFTIDGTLHPEFFESSGGEPDSASAEDRRPAAEPGTLVRWKDLRRCVFELIRGKHSPLSFRIVFQLPREEIAPLIRESGSSLTEEDVNSLSLNCSYRDGSLLLTGGCSLCTFTKERSLERAWDARIVRFMRRIGID